MMILLFAFFLLQGCVKDNLTDCPGTELSVRLGFYFSPMNGNDANGGDVSRMDVFVFDGNGLYLDVVHDASPRMQDADYLLSLTLPAGEYTFVAWGNYGSDYGYTVSPSTFTPGVTSIDDALLCFNRPPNDTITTTIHHLFHGRLSQVTIDNTTWPILMMPVFQNTYDINVELSGVRAGNYRVVISDDHSRYDFDNNRVTTQPLCYAGDCVYDGGLYRAALRTLRLLPGGNTLLKLYDPDGSLLCEASLIDLIQAAIDNDVVLDLDRVHIYNIRLTFDVTHGEFAITINGWNAGKESQTLLP